MFKTKITTTLFALLMMIQATVPAALADFLPVRVTGNDAIAGYATLLKTSVMDEGQDVVFVVKKPDQTIVRVPSKAGIDGIAEADLFGHQTKQAGTYKVTAHFPGSTDTSPQSTFTVHPDKVSLTQSDLIVSDAMVEASGQDETFVTVQLYDSYRNPIPGHQIKLISSRGNDEISAVGEATTNQKGRVNFKVQSDYTGVSTFSAFDVTENQILTDREEVVFIAPEPRKDIGGSGSFSANLLGLQANIGQGEQVIPGPVDYFEIQGLPATAKVGEELSLTVVAKDRNDNTARNYTGTILISVPDDENAQLPSNGEYTFRESDQGKFTFNLALVFSEIGEQTIQILDKNDFKISGETTIEIVPEGAATSGSSASGTNLRVKSPSDGAELASSNVIISGSGNPLINLKVFDNDVKIGDTETDEDGFFTFNAQGLSSGSHTFYVMSEQGTVSPSVNVQIDTIPPVLDFIEAFPDGPVKPGEPVTITVRSEAGLQSAIARVQGVDQDLIEDSSQPGTYKADIAAPQNPGSYPVDIVLVDPLSNKAQLSGRATIQVQSPEPVYPPQVQGLDAQPGDGEVSLSWDSIQDHDYPIQSYQVLYGTTFDDLSQSVNTESEETNFTVTDLPNDTQHFFAVKAVDSQGQVSDQASVTVAATPVAPEEETPVQTEPEPVETQPETQPVSVNVTPSNGAATVSWTPFGGSQVAAYKVYFGLSSGQYDDYVVTQGGRTTAVIRDLINGVPYHFAVAGLNSAGQEVTGLTAEASATPNLTGSGLHGSAPTATLDDQLSQLPQTDQTGPEAVWLVMLSVMFAHFFYHHHKRRLKSSQ